jgi:glycosyltransferase involved in cell wall biosynthesis
MKKPANKIITIIIATYNAEQTLDKCLRSIINQYLPEIELIILDGKSIDKTLDIINDYKEYVDKIISEDDNGIYDAWNKGINLSSGQWIMFLGADDELQGDALRLYLKLIKELKDTEKEMDYISSKVQYINKDSKIITVLGEKFEWSKYVRAMNVAHVGSLHNRNLFNEVGLFDCKYRLCADYELLMRKKEMLKAAFLPIVTAKMMANGRSFCVAALLETRKAKIQTAKKHILMANIEFMLQWIMYVKYKLKMSFFL